jgi:hypothetical protein
MAQKYAKDQPAGFANHIQKVAIVGVSLFESHGSFLKILTLIGWRTCWQGFHGRTTQDWQTHSDCSRTP